MKKIITAFLLILTSTVYAQIQVPKEYKDSLIKMFEVSGTEANYKTSLKQMYQMFKDDRKDVPKEVWVEFEEEFLTHSYSELVDLFAQVYFKYMSIDDMHKLIEFYKTPTGMKFAASTSLITQESMRIGQEWGRQLGEAFKERLKTKGY